MKKMEEKIKKTEAEKKISFTEGLKIVKAIQKKIEEFNKEKHTSHSNDYSL